jgi:hypothetical protein
MDAYLGLLFELLFSGAVLIFCVWQLWSLRRMERAENAADRHDRYGYGDLDTAPQPRPTERADDTPER